MDASSGLGLPSHPEVGQIDVGPRSDRRWIDVGSASELGVRGGAVRRLRVNPERSTVVVEAGSTVGPIAWEGMPLIGEFAFAADVGDGDGIVADASPWGWLELRLESLTSGNQIYDAELLRRVDAHRHPIARVELDELSAAEGDGAYLATGWLEFHGVARRLQGRLDLEAREDGTVLVTGAQDLDIREFGLPPPTMLTLRVYPDIRVHLIVEGEPLD
jgi:hypothetical protein